MEWPTHLGDILLFSSFSSFLSEIPLSSELELQTLTRKGHCQVLRTLELLLQLVVIILLLHVSVRLRRS